MKLSFWCRIGLHKMQADNIHWRWHHRTDCTRVCMRPGCVKVKESNYRKSKKAEEKFKSIESGKYQKAEPGGLSLYRTGGIVVEPESEPQKPDLKLAVGVSCNADGVVVAGEGITYWAMPVILTVASLPFAINALVWWLEWI